MEPHPFIVRIAIMLFLFAPLAMASDWPQWGGTDARNMVSSEKGLPDWFDCGKETADSEVDMATTKNVKWVAELGSKTCGSPVVSHEKVFIGSTTAQNSAVLFCFDEQTGRVLGKFICPKPAKDDVTRCVENWGVASTPTVDGDRLCFVSPYQEVLCLDLNAWIGQEKSVATTKNIPEASEKCIVWKYDLATELHSVEDHLASCSVLVHDNFLYVCTGNGRYHAANRPRPFFPLTPSLVVFDKKTGQLVARDDEQIGERLWRGQWSSPSLGVVNNKAQIYFGAGDGVCYAFEPVNPSAVVPPDRWTTTTLRGPIIKFIKALNTKQSKTDVPGPAEIAAQNSLAKQTPASPVPVETRYVIGGPPVCSPLDSIPTAKVPDVPLLKKIWWFDCIPESYKAMPYFGQASKGDGKGRPSEITGTPVFYRNRVYVAIGGDPNHGGRDLRGNLVCIDATKAGKISQTGRIWSYDKINQSVSTVAISDGLVYALDEADVVHCLDADTGQCYWTYKVAESGTGFNSPLVADGKLFVGGSILSAGKELKVLNSGMPSAQFSTPCVANGVLFTVLGKRLWAICDKQQK